ncbi:MAG: acetyl-CoA hydrolase/transferase C-terminal domain-containing protein [Tissierellia bacterium]|nr:acetyl-CoA hydrolase/transferase C-terminal domain-containing protein [Tissierellia bacterium]
MSWKNTYYKKKMSADDAIKHIKSKDTVVLGHAMGEPQELIRALSRNYKDFKDVEIVQMLGHTGALTDPKYKGHFIYNSLFAGGSTRDAVNDGRADYTPVFFHQIPKLFREKLIDVDVALIMVTPPDDHGYCSFGISVDYTRPAAEAAKLVIAQVNHQMPRTLGNSMIHVNDLDIVVEYEEDLPQLMPPKIGDIEMQIGKYCASLIKDGATIQLGIGAIPDAVLQFLDDKKDLGLHTEMFSDGVIDLIEKGVINNAAKTYMPDLSISTFLMGTQRLYDFVDNNPSIYLASVDFVNNPSVVCKNKGMTSINSAIEVDLNGQIVASSLGHKIFSGVGGQLDFIRGAAMAEEGLSIIAFPSTAAKGKISKIVPDITPGSLVTTTNHDADYIVTEYGIAQLKGHTVKERAQALIGIAHPKFRKDLIEAYEERFKDPFPNKEACLSKEKPGRQE